MSSADLTNRNSAGIFVKGGFFFAVLPLLFAFAAIGAACADESDTMTVETLFEKNDAALAKTERIEIRYKSTENQIGNQTEGEYVWIESPEAKFLQPIEAPTDSWVGDKQTFFSRGGLFFSTYINAEHLSLFAPKTFAESLDSGCHFSRLADSFNWELESPRRKVFFSPVLDQQGNAATLKETFMKNAWQSEPKQSTNDRGEVLWTIYSAAEPLSDEELPPANADWIMIQFNQTKGFWVERFAASTPATGTVVRQDTGEPVSLVADGYVTEYKDLAPNLSIPGKIIHRTVTAKGFLKKDGGSALGRTVLEILEAKLDESSIRPPEVRIPQYAQVFRNDLLEPKATGQERFAPVSFWGANDTPEVTFLASEEDKFDQYVKEHYNASQPLPEPAVTSFSPWRIVLLSAGVLLVIVALVLKRRRSAE